MKPTIRPRAKIPLDQDPKRRPKKDLVGKKYGHVTIQQYAGRVHHNAFWFATCDCGSNKTLCLPLGRLNDAANCGCQKRYKKVHGMWDTKEYSIWSAMMWRVSERSKSRKYYYDRGISVCSGWTLFKNFFNDMGLRPSSKHSLDRWPNNESGGYWCGKCGECRKLGRKLNVRWAVRKQQDTNRRNNRLLTFDGETLCLCEMAEKYGMHPKTLSSRIDILKWTLKKSIETPVRNRKSKFPPAHNE